MQFKKGNYEVTRWCCTSGLCSECHSRGNHGNLGKRRRIVHTNHVSKAWADKVVAGWSGPAFPYGFEPEARRMSCDTAPHVS